MGPATVRPARRAAAAPPATDDADSIGNVLQQNARSWVKTKSFFLKLNFKRRHFIIFILTQCCFERSRSVGDTSLLLSTLCVLFTIFVFCFVPRHLLFCKFMVHSFYKIE